MTRLLPALPAVLLLVLAGCASPGDVADRRQTVLANNARALAENDQDMIQAQEWNTRVLGLPASGALALMIVAIVAVVAVVAGVLVYRYRVRLRVNTDPCAVCGAGYRTRTGR